MRTMYRAIVNKKKIWLPLDIIEQRFEELKIQVAKLKN